MKTPTATVRALAAELRGAGAPERAANEKRYLKSPLRHYGASVPAIRRAVKHALRDAGALSHAALLDIVARLWASDVHEQRMAAVVLLEQQAARLEPGDLAVLEHMIRESFTWAYVDGLAAHAAGSLVERHPELAAQLDAWAEEDCFWLRRSALLALLGPIRAGGGDWRRFTRYADSMLDERDFFIRKAIGWVLREASKKRPERVVAYVTKRLGRLSGLTFREATKRLPASDRARLRKAYEEARQS